MKYITKYLNIDSIIESVITTLYTGDSLTIKQLTRISLYEKMVSLLFKDKNVEVSSNDQVIKETTIGDDRLIFVKLADISECLIRTMHLDSIEYNFITIPEDIDKYDEQQLCDTIVKMSKILINKYMRNIDSDVDDNNPDDVIAITASIAIPLRFFYNMGSSNITFKKDDLTFENVDPEYVKYVLDKLIKYSFSIYDLCDRCGLYDMVII